LGRLPTCASVFPVPTRERDENSRFVASRGLLRCLTAAYAGGAPEEIRFGYGDYGKPFLIEQAKDTVSFNVSHSDHTALLAFAQEPIGIDIESIERRVDFASIAKSVFSAAEREFIFSQTNDKQAEVFFECWVRKEACIKAESGGLSIPLTLFTVRPSPERIWEEIQVDPSLAMSAWRVAGLNAGSGFRAAVAAHRPIEKILLFDLEP
jgi:4'-phosphopantetheinyl transferase